MDWEIFAEKAEGQYKTGNYRRGVIVAQKALRLTERDLGSDHPLLTKCLCILALFYS